jgi:O-antigen/teichoic acid export membrane protein
MIDKIKNLIYRFLTKSQKVTGTDNVYIAKQGSYLIIGNIVNMVAAFLLSIVFARILPKETYGQYRYILSIFAILAISSLQGINDALIRAVAKGFEGALKQSFKTKLKWGLLGSVASIVVAIYFWTLGNFDFTISFLIIAIFLPFFKGGEIYQFYLSGKKLFGKRVSYTTLIQLLSTALIVLTLFLTKSLIILILVYFASYSILRMFFLFWTIKKIKPNNIDDPETIIYGKHLSLIGIITLIVQEIDKILLFQFVGPAQLAIYSFASLPIQYLGTPLEVIQELAYPKLATRPADEIKKTLPRKLIKSIIFILTIIIIFIIIAPYFYKILYPQYLESIPYARLLAFTILVFPVSMMTISLQVKMRTKELYKINIINSIIQIIFLAVLIPFYGIWGIILARLASNIIYFFVTRHYFKIM